MSRLYNTLPLVKLPTKGLLWGSLALGWFALLLLQAEPWQWLSQYSGFTLLGVVGAVFANATGAGGGVVFMPFFNQLDFSVASSVATSFAIQCCGMTAGALTWFRHYKTRVKFDPIQASQWQSLGGVVGMVVPFSLLGIGCVQLAPELATSVSDPHRLHQGFGIFSIALALAIIATALLVNRSDTRAALVWQDRVAIAGIGLLGGGITAWLSIGVGELLAVFLIIRGYNVTFSIAAAVIVSAFSVWGGVLFHIFVTQAVYWPVVLFAGLGAVIGGVLARRLVLYFSARNLKLFFAGWVFILGITALPG